MAAGTTGKLQPGKQEPLLLLLSRSPRIARRYVERVFGSLEASSNELSLTLVQLLIN